MDYSNYPSTSPSSGGQMNPVVLIVYLAIIIIYLAALWKMFSKAGKPGWAAIIPFYNIYTLLKIVGRPGWWLILYFIPIVNIIIGIIISLDLAKSFKRSAAFGILLLWLFSFIGFIILGFGKSQYIGPTAKK